MSSRRCDVCLFAAVPDEFEAIRRVFERLGQTKFTSDFTSSGREVFSGAVQNQFGESLTVQISCLPEMGGSNAAIHIHPILEEFLPRFAGMTGICAGDREKVTLGDLVAAVRAYNYASGKAVIRDGKTEFLDDVKTFAPNDNIISYVNVFSGWKTEVAKLRRPASKRQQREWLLSTLKLSGKRLSELDQKILDANMPQWRRITAEMRQSVKQLIKADGTLTRGALRLMRDPWTPYKDRGEVERFAMVMGSGPAVRSDNPFSSLRGPERKLIAVEMEGASFYQAVENVPSLGKSALVVKGVSDYGDEDKDDTYREYASEASAIYIFYFIECYVNQRLMPRLVPSPSGASVDHQIDKDGPKKLPAGKFTDEALNVAHGANEPTSVPIDARVGATFSSWTFDVALSFAGADRDKARALAEALRAHKLTVFYDEWFKAQIWGSDLIILLRDIYLNRARVCVPLISQSYANGPYPKNELRAMLERELLTSSSSLLPVRLDEAQVPGLSATTACLNYDREGPKGLADLIASRLQVLCGNDSLSIPTSIPSQLEVRLQTHVRKPASESYAISTPELLDKCKDPHQYASAEMRARLARELVIYLNVRHHANLGIPYGAWKSGDWLLLSTLPSLIAQQRTIEFEIDDNSNDLNLVSEWNSSDERYAKFDYWEWQPAVKGLTADRSDVELEREVGILILEKKGATFGFPIVPFGDQPEKLCHWLLEEPPEDYLDWGRDPRLVSDGIGVWDAVEHTPTGVGLLVFVLHGRWSAAGFRAFIESMRLMLPTRHRFKVVSQGTFRVSVFLCATKLWSKDEEVEHWRRTMHRTYASIARMVAAWRQLPLPAPESRSAVPELSKYHSALFSEAEAALGEAEYAKTTDASGSDFYEATWIKLRQSVNASRIGFNYHPLPFNFGDVVLLEDIRNYVEKHESSDT